MRVLFNSREKFYKEPFGALECGNKVTLRLKIYEPLKGLKVSIAMWQVNEKLPLRNMEKVDTLSDGAVIYEISFEVPNEPTLIWYHFVLENFEEKFYYSNNDKQLGGEGKLVENSPISYQMTIYKKDTTPSWYKEGIIYQIFPDRFNRGKDYELRVENTKKRPTKEIGIKYFVEDWNKTPKYDKDSNGKVYKFEFFGGTLEGIIEKIPYLKELGVSMIYLNPIFEARSNHRYDTGDYMKIDSLVGDDESFDNLIKICKDNGIKVILDGVFSHQGADSIYFNKFGNYDSIGAYNSKESKYYNWYNFSKYPDEYNCWWGVDALPNTNELEKTYLDFICKDRDSVVKYWMKRGIGGFRLDVADELPDEFIVEVRNAMNEINNDSILLGEVWEDASNKVSYDVNRKYFIDKSLQSVTNYPFMKNIIGFMKGSISPYDLYEFFYKQMENYPREYFYSNANLVDSHDRVRIITELSDSPANDTLNDDERYNFVIPRDKYLLAVSRLRVLSVIQYTLPGVPMLYYGDEVGMYGYTDPYNRKTYPWGKEDEDLLAHYVAIGKMRVDSEVIRKGEFKPLFAGKHVFGFSRKYKNEVVYVFINRAIFNNEEENIVLELDNDIVENKLVDLLNSKEIIIKDRKININLQPLSYYVLRGEINAK